MKRSVNAYDNDSGELIKSVVIDLPVEQLKKLVKVRPGDAQLELGYVLDKPGVTAISAAAGSALPINFTQYFYVLESNS